jgi:ATP-dependent protease ClpP protease subunit
VFKSVMVSIVFMLVASASATAKGLTFVANPNRTVYVDGVVNGRIMDEAVHIIDLVADSREPIDIVINSPGGSVLAGLQFISALNLAQARGVKIRCVVPVLAASMGFQILAHCDERYALKYAMLLWHPVKIDAAMSLDDMLYASDRVRSMERPLIAFLIRKLGISRELFFYHYRRETLWLAYEFNSLSPDFLTTVDDIQNVQGLFRMQ